MAAPQRWAAKLAVAMALLAAPAVSQLPLEDELRANVNVVSTQEQARVAFDSQMAALVFWRDFAPHGIQLVGRRFAADGTSSSESVVAPPPVGLVGAVSTNASGKGILAFGATPFTRLQRLNGVGEPEGSQILVNDPASYFYGDPRVKLSDRGRFVLAMHSLPNRQGPVSQQIAARAYDASAAPVTPLFEISTDADRSHFIGGVGVDREGNFAVLFSQEIPEGTSHRDQVLLRRYNALGQPLGPPFDPTPPSTQSKLAWDLDMHPDGRFVIVWSVGPFNDLFARLFGADGQPLGDAFAVNQHLPSAQYNASVDMDSAGNFAIVWESSFQGGIGEIYARLFRPDGRPASNEFHVNQKAPEFIEEDADIALHDSGLLAVTWTNWYTGDGDFQAVMLRRFLATCPPDATFLELRGGRFKLCARWETTTGLLGAATPVAWSDEAGAFWFFSPSNLELLVKVLDGCSVNQRFWLYAAGLTDVGVDLALLDTWTGQVKSYSRPRGVPFQPIQDVDALATCDATQPALPTPLSEALPSVRAEPPLCRVR